MSKTQTYPRDLTDEQWRLVSPLLPKRNIAKPGRPRLVQQRDILDAIFYILRSACPWRLLPHDFPPWGTVSSPFYRWRKSGRWQHIHDALRRQTRLSMGKKPSPTVDFLDSQSVKTAEAGGPRGYDGGTKITSRKRHVVIDTLGLLLAVVITPANVQDYDGAKLVFDKIGRKFPAMKTIYADSIYVCNGLVTWVYCLLAEVFGDRQPAGRIEAVGGSGQALDRRTNVSVAEPLSSLEQGLRAGVGGE